jgi:hypothetical protein
MLLTDLQALIRLKFRALRRRIAEQMTALTATSAEPIARSGGRILRFADNDNSFAPSR